MPGLLRHLDEHRRGGRVAVAHQAAAETEQMARLELLFAEHHQRVLRAAYRITGNMADAEDVAQSVFLRLLHGEGSGMDNPGSYLYRSAINGALDLLRHKQAERTAPLETAEGVRDRASGSSPDGLLSEAEIRAALRRSLTVLSARAAEMFVLRYLEDRDNREIAHLMHTSQAVVAVVLHQSRSKVKKQLQAFLRGKP